MAGRGKDTQSTTAFSASLLTDDIDEEQELHIDDVFAVEMVAFVNFDISNGTLMTEKYPEDASFDPFPLQFLANCALPDGAHFHQTDQSYNVLHTESGAKYGIAFFRNKSDKSASRGAIQRALVIVSRLPHFHIFEQPAYELIEASMNSPADSPNELLIRLYNALKIQPQDVVTTSGLETTCHKVNVTVFEHSYKLSIPAFYAPLRYNGTSLLYLRNHLKENIMLVWYYLLHEKRILFIGEKAQSVGLCCLTCCQIVSPLLVDERVLVPYVTLPDIDQLLGRSAYIAGSTNQLLFQRADWFDLAIDLTTMEIQQSKKKYKLSKEDKLFFNHLQEKEVPSDAWLEDQFTGYTLNFLLAFRDNLLPKRVAKPFSEFQNGNLYKKFMGSSRGRKVLKKFEVQKSRAVAIRPPSRSRSASASLKRRLSTSMKGGTSSITKERSLTQSNEPTEPNVAPKLHKKMSRLNSHSLSSSECLSHTRRESEDNLVVPKPLPKRTLSSNNANTRSSNIQAIPKLSFETSPRDQFESPRLRASHSARKRGKLSSLDSPRSPIRSPNSSTENFSEDLTSQFYWESMLDDIHENDEGTSMPIIQHSVFTGTPRTLIDFEQDQSFISNQHSSSDSVHTARMKVEFHDSLEIQNDLVSNPIQNRLQRKFKTSLPSPDKKAVEKRRCTAEDELSCPDTDDSSLDSDTSQSTVNSKPHNTKKKSLNLDLSLVSTAVLVCASIFLYFSFFVDHFSS